jgi:hypothetical protein
MITIFGEGRGFRVVWLLEEMRLAYRLRPVDLLVGVENDPAAPPHARRNRPIRLESADWPDGEVGPSAVSLGRLSPHRKITEAD